MEALLLLILLLLQLSLMRLNKKVKSSMARSLPVENLLKRMWGHLSTTCHNLLK